MPLVIASAALGGRVIGGAGLTRIEVRDCLAEVVLDHLQLRDLLADLLLLLEEQRAHARARFGRRARALKVAHEALDLGQREADRLQLDDPMDAIDRLRTVETKSTFGARARLEQTQLLIEVHRSDGLADR